MTNRQKDHVRSFDELFAATHETRIFLLIGEVEARELWAGRVPESVKEQARAACDWQFPDVQRSQRKVG